MTGQWLFSRGVAEIGAVLFMGLCAAVLPGCKTTAAHSNPRRPVPPYSEIVEKCNARTDRLARIWAGAVTSFTWKDEDGRSHYEQGNGFFELVQPSNFALDIGKVGEVAMWMGCNQDRYWLIERGDKRVARVGRHDGPGVERLKDLGFPGTPKDLIDLAGVTPLPPNDKPVEIGWTDGGLWRVVHDEPYGQLVRELDPDTGEPRKIEILNEDGQVRILSKLDKYGPVELEGVGGYFPMIATQIIVEDLDNSSKMQISLERMSDGIRGARVPRLTPEIFQFEKLCQRLGVQRVIDLDAPVPVPVDDR